MKRLLIPAAIALALYPGTASANFVEPEFDCDGVVFDMPRTEADTTVTVTRNGQTVRTVDNDTFGAPVRFTIASPDRSAPQSWRIVVSSPNGTQVYAETVAPCVTPTTVTPTTTQVTVPPSSTTSTTPPPSTVPTTSTVGVAQPPVPPPTVVVTPPRTPAPTTSVPTTFTLPETGSSLTLAVTAACVSALGLFFVLARRSRGGES